MTRIANLPQLLFDAVDRFGTKRAAMCYHDGDRWRDVTHQELARRVHHIAVGLRELGLAAGDRVAILSPSRPEWVMADFACLCLGCIDVAIYPSLPANQIAYLLQDSGARAVFVADTDQLVKIDEVRADLPALEHVIILDPPGDDREVMTFTQLAALGAAGEVHYPEYRDAALAIGPDTVATLIYTSGTTGPPKGVMLTHRNFTSNVEAVVNLLPLGSDDIALSILPLSHGFERMAGCYTMLSAGTTIVYAESMARVPQNMREICPTVMVSVPRLYEKIHARVVEQALAGGAVRKRIFHWIRRVGDAWVDARLRDAPVPPGLALKHRIADRLVFRKLRARTGGRLRYFVSGGAPLGTGIARFFYAAGLPILEGYGLTETSPVITVNPYDAPRLGTVGPPIPGVEVRIADDGEILVRGPNVMAGYYGRPEATAEAIDPDHWFHTGDMGEFDEAGYLMITGRKKDLIVTAGGKKIAPQPIEHRVQSSLFVHNAVMIGDRRKFAVILVVPNLEMCATWARQHRIPFTEPRELLDNPQVVAKVEREVMLHLRDLARFEMPKKILLIPDDFTEERDELTPTLKVKRSVVEDHYRELIDAAYRDPPDEPDPEPPPES